MVGSEERAASTVVAGKLQRLVLITLTTAVLLGLLQRYGCINFPFNWIMYDWTRVEGNQDVSYYPGRFYCYAEAGLHATAHQP